MKGSFFSRNTRLISQKIIASWHSFNHWFFTTPERAILEAYQAAQAIHKIEIEQFGGKKISAESGNYSANVMAFWRGDLNRNLTIIKVRLAEFKLGLTIADTADSNLLEKLKFIDETISKYSKQDEAITEPLSINLELKTVTNQANSEETEIIELYKEPSATQKKGIFPRSIGRTFNKIAKDFTPTAEEEFVRNYRTSRTRTRRAVRFLLLLIIIPLLTQHFSKQLLLKPILQYFQSENTPTIFLNSEMEEKALNELKSFERKLQFERLLRQA
ncbi:MAG: proton extrusion protein PcxA, partial [Sphaerospermopsis kisseleviana]